MSLQHWVAVFAKSWRVASFSVPQGMGGLCTYKMWGGGCAVCGLRKCAGDGFCSVNNDDNPVGYCCLTMHFITP